MSFASRAAVALSGIGSGLLGFWLMWSAITLLGENPASAHDAWLLSAIFAPGVVGALLVFRSVSRATAPRPV